jgi:hypothetical protein
LDRAKKAGENNRYAVVTKTYHFENEGSFIPEFNLPNASIRPVVKESFPT